MGTMKISRSWLLGITAGLGVLMIVYSLLRQFAGLNLGEKFERFFFDTIFMAAIALFLWNRKIATDERKAAEQKKKDTAALEPPEPSDPSKQKDTD
jgi:hypothetical protein